MTTEDLKKILEDHKIWLTDQTKGKRADLSFANLSSADLSFANLRYANLLFENLRYANLRFADLSFADLRSANLSSAHFSYANLRYANLSSAKALKSSIDCLSEMFKKNKSGFIVYKTFGLQREPNKNWIIKAKSIISENVNYNRTEDCGCGVNFATKEWLKKNNNKNLEVWECLIKFEWLSGVVIPYTTDGKARCERLQLIKRLK